jgi:hypothetical protein
MEVFMMEPFEAFRGIMGKLVYSAFNEGHMCFSREYVIPTPTDNTEKIGDIGENLAVVYSSF